MNSKTATLLIISVALMLGALVVQKGDLAWMALPFLAYLGIGLLQAPTTGAVRLAAARRVSKTRSASEPSVEIEIAVSNRGAPLDNLFLVDPLLEGMHLTSGQPFQRLALRAGEETILRYSFLENRGLYSWKTTQAIASDPLGLFAVELALPAPADHSVQPEYSKFQRLNIRPRGTLHSPGSIPARMAGSGTDFWGIREYHPGDSLRWLDWRLIARHPGQFFTKEFEQEEIADIGLILDARQKAYTQVDGRKLFEYAVGAASSLAEAFLHQGHRVSLLALNETINAVYPGYGKVQLNRILRRLSKIEAGDNPSISRLDYLPLRTFSSHALLVVISPMVIEDVPYFYRLRASGYQVLLISPNPFDFSAALFTKDPLNQMAFRAVRVKRALRLRDITRLQIPVIDWPVSQPLYPLVRGAIGHTRGQREL
jgi:uncharacterized protein (DUF58 family)